MKIIEYINANDISVKFNSGDIKRGEYKSFKIGNMKSVYDKTVCGVGYVGIGKYNVRDLSGNICRQYQTWRDMLRRCYDEKSLSKNPTYNKCTVCDEWLNCQTFAEWYDKNYYTVDNHKMHIDKDIMIKGNAEYNPSSCIFCSSAN